MEEKFKKRDLNESIEEKEKRKKNNRRRRDLENRYGLKFNEYHSLLRKQDNKCAICKINFEKLNRNPSIDHDHNTGKIRGILCHQCNILIGMCFENEEILENAIDYLINNKD